jgi:hypothetical protein
MTYDNSTAVAILSGLLGSDFDTMNPAITSTIFEALSANGTLAQLESLQATLSAYSQLPPHPWDQLKYKLLGEDHENYVPISLSAIELPKDFKAQDHVNTILTVAKRSSEHSLDVFSKARHAGDVDFDFMHKTHFTDEVPHENGGTKLVYNENKHRKFVEFIEFVHTLDTTKMADHTEAAKKIVYHFANVFR